MYDLINLFTWRTALLVLALVLVVLQLQVQVKVQPQVKVQLQLQAQLQAQLPLPLQPQSEAEPLWSQVCEEESVRHLPFCDASLAIEDRVTDYTTRVPVEQQILMMGNDAAGFDALHIPPYQWWSEGLHGPLEPCVEYQDEWRCPTSFPCPSALGMAFNRSLYTNLAKAIAKEGRAISHLRSHDVSVGDGITYWSPNVNLQRDPRWGRNQEAPGEDPLLTSLYARHFIQGLQGSDRDSDSDDTSDTSESSPLNIAACCKHFVANSLEHWKTASRHTFDAHISPHDLHEYYFPPFRECVDSGVAGIMCSYNALNGEPACLNTALLVDTLRHDWNFTGYLVTDCGALQDTISGHHAVVDDVQASARAINATVDLNCGKTYVKGLAHAYQEKWIEAATIQASFARLATIQFRLGLFDKHPKPFHPDADSQNIGSPIHASLALEAALQSISLLKHDHHNPILPLHKDERIALIGPHIHGQEVFLSNYHGERCSRVDDKGSPNYDCIETLFQALSKRSDFHIQPVVGCQVDGTKVQELDQAVVAAQMADKVILVLGLDQSQEREELDRVNTTLPGLQMRLVERILEVAAEKTILVLIHGGALSLGKYVLEHTPAIVSAPYGGQAAAEALAQILYGDYNPTAKLAATWYPPTFVDDLPLTEMSLTKGVGRTHRYYQGTPEFAFGEGFSYSEWDLAVLDSQEWVLDASAPSSSTSSNALTIQVEVTNMGPLAGHQTVLVFWRPTTSTRLKQKLADFQGTALLEVGQSETIEFQIQKDQFTTWNDAERRQTVTPGTYELLFQAAADVQVIQTISICNVYMEETLTTVPEDAMTLSS